MRTVIGGLVVLASLAFGSASAMAGTAASLAATEGQAFNDVAVDTVSGCSPSELQNIQIDWGDGETSSGGSFEEGPNSCGIAGSHTYAEEGHYTTEITYMFASGGVGEDAGSATVSDAAVMNSSVNDFMVAAGSAISGVVANWSDSAPEPLSGYSATIDWGDGHTTAGTIANGTVSGNHTYVNGARYAITVTLHDEGGASAATHEHAFVSGCPTSATSNPGSAFNPPGNGLDERWVQAIFHDVLGRAPAGLELNDLLAGLSEGATREQVALGLLHSSEYRTNLISAYFDRYLHRNPTPNETNGLLTFLQSGGSDEGLAAELLGSNEYFTNRADSSNDAFLAAMYCDTLFRSIDQFAQNNDDAALGTATPRSTIASDVLNSIDYLSGDVNAYYLRYLHRNAAPNERLAEANAIKSGQTDEDVIASLLASPEYFDIFNPRVAVTTISITRGGTITTTLGSRARLVLTVLRTLPSGHTAAVTVPRPHTGLIGVVDFGVHRKGRVKLDWTRRVQGRRLKKGRYLLILKAYKGHRVIGVSDAISFTIR